MPTATPASKRHFRAPSFSIQIILGLLAGVGLGAIALALGNGPEGSDPNWLTQTLDTVGGIFVSLLRVIVIPLVFTAIVASIANLRNVSNAARLAGKTLLWFAITALISVSIGIVLGIVTKPGTVAGIDLSGAKDPTKTGSWLDFLHGLVPGNILGLEAKSQVEAGAEGAVGSVSTALNFNVLQLLVVAIAIGIAALRVGRKAEPFLSLNASLLAIVQKVLWWVIRLAPLGTAGLIGTAVASYGWSSLAPLGVFALDVYAGMLIVLLVVYPVILRMNRLSIRRFFSGAWPAIELGFVSRSSIGTLPVTQAVTVKNMGVPSEYASFASPLAATTKMDGCASIYPALAAIFIAQIYGINLSITDYLLIAFVSVVGSAATAGLTGAVVMLTLTLSTLGLPLAGVGLLMSIDPILDMGRTALNVAGQVLVPTVVAKRERILDQARYDSGNAEALLDDDTEEVKEPVVMAG